MDIIEPKKKRLKTASLVLSYRVRNTSLNASNTSRII